MSSRKKLMLIDGNAIFYRAYYAIRHLTNNEGQPTNAIYGFVQMLLKAYTEVKPDYAILTWDSKTSAGARKKLFDGYKATRKTMPDDFYAQVDFVREFAKALGLPFVELEGYEADDIIGTLVTKHKDYSIVVLTNDRDTFQLLDNAPDVSIYMSLKGMTDTAIMNAAGVKEKYNIEPDQIIDMKAIGGDASDNIPGVPGIGEKGAQNLLAEYKTLDGVYEHLDEIKGALHDKLVTGKESAYMSQKLATIITDAPIDLDIEDAATNKLDRAALHELFHRLSFKSLLAKLPAEEAAEQPNLFNTTVVPKVRTHHETAKYISVTTEAKLNELVKELAGQKEFAFDTETDSVDVVTANLVGMAVSFKEAEAYYIPVGHKDGEQLDTKTAIEALRPILEDEKVTKIGHNIKFDYDIMRQHGVKLTGIGFDTMVAAFIVNPLGRSQTLSDLAYSELGIEMMPIEELIGTGKNQQSFDVANIEDATRYAAEDADITWRLYQKLKPQLTGKLKTLAETTDWPLIPVLGEMELAGITLDLDYLAKFNKVISKRILELEQQIWKLAGENFNIASPSQLSRILFEKLGLVVQGVKKGKTGSLSTAARELEKMRGLHPIVDLIFEYRELMKLKTTYVDALPQLVNAKDGRIHTSYSQTITQTGRLNSVNPNLQNIPVRTEIGRQIREAFVAPKGRTFVSADYSQIELRVAAALSKDEGMIQAFRDGVDIHVQTAAKMFGIDPEKVTKEQRYAAKTINFGVLYGMSVHRVSIETGMDFPEAKDFVDRYFGLRPKLKEFIDQTLEAARKNGYVETLLGRRRPCPEINSNNFMLRSAAERYAVNVPIQGTAADIMRLAMIAVAPKLEGKGDLLLQIHDELIVECDEKNAEEVSAIMKEAMEEVYDLGVPLEVETAIATKWGDLK